ncbi:hypothetical protein C8J56DRAFT_1066956 [Mycena floridula]|nr:hypothetical protein C8J56DRAFT_1066956 [Mycena floridula]
MVSDKGKGPSTDASTVPVSQELLMAILYRIDALTAQVSDLALTQSGARVDALSSAQAPETQEEKDEEDSHVEDAEKSVDDDDGDTVVIEPRPSSCQAASCEAASGGPSTSVSDPNPHFLTCPNCQHRFPPPPPRENWYVVTRGTQVGIFQDWNVAARHVVGVKGAVFKRYATQAEAEAAFNAALASGFVQVIA